MLNQKAERGTTEIKPQKYIASVFSLPKQLCTQNSDVLRKLPNINLLCHSRAIYQNVLFCNWQILPYIICVLILRTNCKLKQKKSHRKKKTTKNKEIFALTVSLSEVHKQWGNEKRECMKALDLALNLYKPVKSNVRPLLQ